MTHSRSVPEALAHLTDLSLDATGTFVLYATDDYFAPAEALVTAVETGETFRAGAIDEKLLDASFGG